MLVPVSLATPKELWCRAYWCHWCPIAGALNIRSRTPVFGNHQVKGESPQKEGNEDCAVHHRWLSCVPASVHVARRDGGPTISSWRGTSDHLRLDVGCRAEMAVTAAGSVVGCVAGFVGFVAGLWRRRTALLSQPPCLPTASRGDYKSDSSSSATALRVSHVSQMAYLSVSTSSLVEDGATSLSTSILSSTRIDSSNNWRPSSCARPTVSCHQLRPRPAAYSKQISTGRRRTAKGGHEPATLVGPGSSLREMGRVGGSPGVVVFVCDRTSLRSLQRVERALKMRSESADTGCT